MRVCALALQPGLAGNDREPSGSLFTSGTASHVSDNHSGIPGDMNSVQGFVPMAGNAATAEFGVVSQPLALPPPPAQRQLMPRHSRQPQQQLSGALFSGFGPEPEAAAAPAYGMPLPGDSAGMTAGHAPSPFQLPGSGAVTLGPLSPAAAAIAAAKAAAAAASPGRSPFAAATMSPFAVAPVPVDMADVPADVDAAEAAVAATRAYRQQQATHGGRQEIPGKSVLLDGCD